jgi:hypothetical protein
VYPFKKTEPKKNNMKKICSSIYIASVLFLISCGSNKSGTDELSSDIKEVTSAQNSSTSDAALAPNNLPVQNVQPQTQAATAAITPAAITPAGTNTSGVKLNPAHGQPGHDCAIAVGAPLTGNGSAKANPVQITTSPVQSSAAITPAPVKPGMNPAHGQPGHRCEIAVGAPLSSAPPLNASSATQSGLPQKISLPTVTTAPPVLTPAVATGPGLNPAHGQPGHRCEIAVGAPLPKQ